MRKQQEFLRGKTQRFATPCCAMPLDIDLEVSDAQLIVVCCGAAQQRFDPREQFREGERFHEVIVRAELKPFDSVANTVARGEEQDRHLFSSCPQWPDHVPTV